MVIIGVIAHRNGAAATVIGLGEGGDAGPLGNRQQVLLEHQLLSHQAPALPPVGHQGQSLATLQRAGPGLPRRGEKAAGP